MVSKKEQVHRITQHPKCEIGPTRETDQARSVRQETPRLIEDDRSMLYSNYMCMRSSALLLQTDWIFGSLTEAKKARDNKTDTDTAYE